MRKAIWGLLIAIALGVTVSLPAWAQTEACKTQANENRFMNKINNARENNGLNRLTKDLSLVRVSRHYSGKMIEGGYFVHSDEPPSPHRNTFHLTTDWTGWGENLGRGKSVNSLFQEMMNSQEHRDNILAPFWDYLGTGIDKDSDGRLWVTVQFWEGPNPGVRNFQSC